MIEHDFGMRRIVEPAWAIPVAAWKIDNSRTLCEDELCIQIQSIKVEDASFRQLCQTCHYDKDKIKSKIFDIIAKRGKLHNPSTDSGGILCGTIAEIGPKYKNKDKMNIDDKVICISSLTGIPLHLEAIHSIDFHYGQLEVSGYAILFSSCPLLSLPHDLDISYTLAAIEESSSLNRIYQLAKDKKDKRFLILGNDLLSVLLYASAIRKAAGKDCRTVAALDLASVEYLQRQEINLALSEYIDDLYILDILSPLKSFHEISKKEKSLFDISVNCADLLGAEAISVLLTKEKGTIVFTSFVNNRNLAVLFAESLSKELSTCSFDEYTNNYQFFTLEFIRGIQKELDMLDGIYKKHAITKDVSDKRKALSRFQDAGRISDFVFASENMKALVDEALNIAEYDCNVILHGETGVGKEKVLGLIHNNSSRKFHPCIKINCAAIPETLAESEFFGYESGAFTGSNVSGKPGYFELANNGILFLDEVGLLPLGLQAKLLRVLQENQFFRIGGRNQIDVNVRVICASNIKLSDLVKAGKFREDLYYRLNICEITIPPLRERPEDIPCMAEHFLQKYNEVYHKEKRLDDNVMNLMLEYKWPGNVRELENTLHRMVINTREDMIGSGALLRILGQSESGGIHPVSPAQSDADYGYGLDHTIMHYEKQLIEDALRKWKSTRKAAEHLGISQSQLMRKKQKYGIRNTKDGSI